MKADSQSMKVIAVVTMLFLPAATVGVNLPCHTTSVLLTKGKSICGSQFFSFDDESKRVRVSIDFRWFWASTLPLTALVFVGFAVWRHLEHRAMRDVKVSTTGRAE